jgi:hypothetical protein
MSRTDNALIHECVAAQMVVIEEVMREDRNILRALAQRARLACGAPFGCID